MTKKELSEELIDELLEGIRDRYKKKCEDEINDMLDERCKHEFILNTKCILHLQNEIDKRIDSPLIGFECRKCGRLKDFILKYELVEDRNDV